MNLFLALKILIKEPKSYLGYWRNNFYIQCKYPGITMNFPVIWNVDNYNFLKIGANVYIGAFSEIVVTEKAPESSVKGCLTLSDRVAIGNSANIRAVGGEIFIGPNSILAQNVSLIASNHLISKEKPYQDLPWDEFKVGIYIDENVWIGAGVIILPGCTIGKNSVIGSGSVVTKNVPTNEVWVGVPAKKLRDLE